VYHVRWREIWIADANNNYLCNGNTCNKMYKFLAKLAGGRFASSLNCNGLGAARCCIPSAYTFALRLQSVGRHDSVLALCCRASL